MSANPFGNCGHEEAQAGHHCPVCGRRKHVRLDKLDFTDFSDPNMENCGGAPSEQLIALQLMTDAANNYLYFGLGRNGTTIEEFWYGYEFFFQVRSNKPESWQHAKYMRTVAVNPETGKRETIIQQLSDMQLEAMCFDTWYSLSGLENLLSIDRFCSWLKRTRREILEDNESQVREYIAMLKRVALSEIGPGHQIPMEYEGLTRSMIDTLVEPSDPAELAALVFYQRKLRRTLRDHRKAVVRLTVKTMAAIQRGKPLAKKLCPQAEARLKAEALLGDFFPIRRKKRDEDTIHYPVHDSAGCHNQLLVGCGISA
jgi:hypothetical protein